MYNTYYNLIFDNFYSPMKKIYMLFLLCRKLTEAQKCHLFAWCHRKH